MTILDLKTAIASYFEVAVADLTVNGQDLALLALNQVRRKAELECDFEFQRKLVTVSVDPVTGGSLGNAVLYGTSTAAIVKTVLDIGTFDTAANFRPVEWTTVAEGIERQRKEERYTLSTYATEGDLRAVDTARRYLLTNDTLYRFPKESTVDAATLGLEVYVFSPDWTASSSTLAVTGGTGVTGVNTTFYQYGYYTKTTADGSRPLWLSSAIGGGGAAAATYAIWHKSNSAGFVLSLASDIGNTTASNTHVFTSGLLARPSGAATAASGTFTGTATVAATDVDSTSDTWTEYAAQYLQWGAIVHLNHLFKHFVFRQEGNLPPPEKLRDDGLVAFKDWDSARYENNRRHSR